MKEISSSKLSSYPSIQNTHNCSFLEGHLGGLGHGRWQWKSMRNEGVQAAHKQGILAGLLADSLHYPHFKMHRELSLSYVLIISNCNMRVKCAGTKCAARRV